MYSLLAGIRIVEVSAFVAVPFCGNTLAQLGADVIRVDPPNGGTDIRRWPLSPEGRSLYRVGLNHAKKSLGLDLRSVEGQDILLEMLGHDGIVITNFASSFLTDPALRRERPGLIIAVLDGFPDGRTAVDYTIAAASGIPLLTGESGTDNPINSPLPTWDLVAGLQLAVVILAAERRRAQTGKGAMINVALSDVMLSGLSSLGFLAEAALSTGCRPRIGNHIYGGFGHDFKTRDGHRLMIVALTLRQWRELCLLTDLADRLTVLQSVLDLNFDLEGDRYAARDEIRGVFEVWFGSHSLLEIEAMFSGSGVCWQTYGTVRDLISQGGLVEQSPILERVAQPGVGDIWIAGPVARFEGEIRHATRAAPEFGSYSEQNAEIEHALSRRRSGNGPQR